MMEDHRSFRDGIFIIEGVIRAAEVVIGVVRHFRAGGCVFRFPRGGDWKDFFESEEEKMSFLSF